TGDAWSRVGNAYYVLFSRDPHLAAIGFVWNPLPSLVELPLLPFAALWPALVDRGFAGNLMSAVFMAMAVRQLWLWLAGLAVRTPVRIALTLAFAVHPLIVIYGANGMSDAPCLLFLIIVGSPCETFTSVYGGSSQIRLGIDYIREATGQGTSAGLVYLAQQLLGLEPLLPFIALAAAAVALARRDPRLIAVLAVLGSV